MAERKKASVGRGARATVKSFIKSFTSLNPRSEQARIDKKLRALVMDPRFLKSGKKALSIEAHEGGETTRTTATPRAFGPPRITRETRKRKKS